MLTDEEMQAEATRKLVSLIALAKANFPRTSDIRIETCGLDPRGSFTVPAYVLEQILKNK